MPQGANTKAQSTNGTQPKQRCWKIFTKLRTPTQFSKTPKFQNPKLKFLHNLRKIIKESIRNSYLEDDLQKKTWNWWGFEEK